MTAAVIEVEELVWTPKEAAVRLKVCTKTLLKMTRAGEVVSVRVGGKKMYREPDLRTYIESLEPVRLSK